MKVQILSALLVAAVTSCCAQYAEGPPPPRINIPGAISIPIRTPQALRPPPVRVRKQPLNSIPAPAARFISLPEAKPVVEEIQEEQFVPQILTSQEGAQSSQPSLPQPPQSLFTNDPQDLPPRPAPQVLQIPPSFAAQKFALSQERPGPVRNNQPQFRNSKPAGPPQHRPIFRDQPNQRFSDEQDEHKPRKVNVRVPEVARAVDYQRPSNSQQFQQQQQRDRKPVSQTIRKWRDEAEDGTITWGYENDDGSFKEEVIGIDCVTRGSYGYVDPDGLKREYNYETGNLCDPNKRDQDQLEQEEEEALLLENRPVFQNIGQAKLKRPQQPQQQQQQFYRN